MYASYYKLTGLPFKLSPDPRFYFGSRSHKKAMAYLTYGLNQGEGFIIITGDIGAGKTTLVGHLFSQLDSTKFLAAKVVTTQLEADDTLRMVASAFGLKAEGADKASLLRQIENFLASAHAEGKRVLLVVDEAQNLPVRSLEELRMLSNFMRGETALLQSFLVGQPQFRAILASDELEQLRQRVIASYHLEPLDLEEMRSYIEHRLRTVGWRDDPAFDEQVYELLHEATGGVPRKINTLCSRLLLFGFIEDKHRIDADMVQEVVRDLNKENSDPLKAAEAGADDAFAVPGVASPAIPPSNGSVATAAAADPALAGQIAALGERLALLEQYVREHDRTIKQALDIAAQWLDGDVAEAG